MSTLSNYQRPRTSSKKRRTVLYSAQKLHHTKWRNPTQPRGKEIPTKQTVSTDSWAICLKICRNRAPNKTLPTWKSGKIPALQAVYLPAKTRITQRPVKWFAIKISWLISIRDELPLKDISEQTQFRFAVLEQAPTDNRNTNKWQVTCSMYNRFDRCDFCKVCTGGFRDTKT